MVAMEIAGEGTVGCACGALFVDAIAWGEIATYGYGLAASGDGKGMDAYDILALAESGHGFEMGLQLMELLDGRHGEQNVFQACGYYLYGEGWMGWQIGEEVGKGFGLVALMEGGEALLHPNGAIGADLDGEHSGECLDGVASGG